MMSLNGVSIAGVGMTQITRNSGLSPYGLALRASLAAIEDAGLMPNAVDGVVTHQLSDSVSSLEIASGIGLPGVSYYNDIEQGGAGGLACVGDAAMACAAGLARTLLVVRAMNGRSGLRMGHYWRSRNADGFRQWTLPYGLDTPARIHALWAQRYASVYGMREEHTGAVAVTLREHAQLNPNAYFYGKPINLSDYLESRVVASPLRLLDCCLETDGAAALILTSDNIARNLRRVPVHIGSFVNGAGPSSAHPSLEWPDHSTMFTAHVRKSLFSSAGLSPSDVDVALIYDAFTTAVIMQLEDLGFAAKGEGGAYVEEGNIKLGGSLPVNPSGGLLSEGYIQGMNNVVEAVRQLRHDCGDRQVPNAEVALITGNIGPRGSAALLYR